MSERGTSELIRTLMEDWEECYSLLLRKLDEGIPQDDETRLVDSDFASRQLIRAGFALIEGTAYVLKIEAMFNAEANGVELTPQEHHFIFEADFRLSDKGEVVQTNAKIPLAQNLRFALRTLEKANRLDPIFDARQAWWRNLRHSIKVRDRLMHPRWPEDLDVTARDTIAMARAVFGFRDTITTILDARPAVAREA